MITPKELRAKMNSACDSANVLARTIERSLGEMSVGIPSSVNVGSDYILHYGRFNGKFRLYVLDTTNGHTTAWDNLPRNVRIIAGAGLGELLDDIINQASTMLDRYHETTLAVSRTLMDAGWYSGQLNQQGSSKTDRT